MTKTASTKSWKIRVIVWAGTQQREFFVRSYHEAMAIVDRWHQNSHSPQFFDRAGNRLCDNGSYLATADGTDGIG